MFKVEDDSSSEGVIAKNCTVKIETFRYQTINNFNLQTNGDKCKKWMIHMI